MRVIVFIGVIILVLGCRPENNYSTKLKENKELKLKDTVNYPSETKEPIPTKSYSSVVVDSCPCSEDYTINKAIQLKNGEVLSLCSYEKIVSGTVEVSEFELVKCNDDKDSLLLNFLPMSYYSFDFEKDTLKITLSKEMENSSGDFGATPFLVYYYFIEKDRLQSTKKVLYNAPKIKKARRNELIGWIDNNTITRLPTDKQSKAILELFYLAINGDDVAIHNFSLLDTKFDGSVGETYEDLSKLLETAQ